MMLSAVMEDYLKAIYHLQAASDERVRTSEIAERLDVTPPTVTSMIEKLDDRGLVDRKKYGGVTLTMEGEQVAIEVIRHHRLLEAYLTEHLDYSWSEVHDEADRLEHHISEDFEARVAAALDDPSIDPHGDPIPTADLEPPARQSDDSLGDCDEGDTVEVSRVSDRDRSVLEYLEERGVAPGSKLTIVEIAPFGMVTVKVNETETVSLPQRIAHDVRVVREENSSPSDPQSVS